MCDHHRLTGVQANNESLMPVSIDIIGENPENFSSSLNLKTASATLKGPGQDLVALTDSAQVTLTNSAQVTLTNSARLTLTDIVLRSRLQTLLCESEITKPNDNGQIQQFLNSRTSHNFLPEISHVTAPKISNCQTATQGNGRS